MLKGNRVDREEGRRGHTGHPVGTSESVTKKSVLLERTLSRSAWQMASPPADQGCEWNRMRGVTYGWAITLEAWGKEAKIFGEGRLLGLSRKSAERIR